MSYKKYKNKLEKVCETICEEVESLEEYKRRIYEIDDELLEKTYVSAYGETYNKEKELKSLYSTYLFEIKFKLEYINAKNITIDKGEYLIKGGDWLLYKPDGLYKLTNSYKKSHDIIKDYINNGDIIKSSNLCCHLYKVKNPITVKCLGIAKNIQMTFYNLKDNITYTLDHKKITDIINKLEQ